MVSLEGGVIPSYVGIAASRVEGTFEAGECETPSPSSCCRMTCTPVTPSSVKISPFLGSRRIVQTDFLRNVKYKHAIHKLYAYPTTVCVGGGPLVLGSGGGDRRRESAGINFLCSSLSCVKRKKEWVLFTQYTLVVAHQELPLPLL